MTKEQKDIFGFFTKKSGRTSAPAPADAAPPADADDDTADAALQLQADVDAASIAAAHAPAAPEAAPSAAAAEEEVHDDSMEVDEEPAEMPDQVEEMEMEIEVEADSNLSAVLNNEADEGIEAEAGDEATSPGGKHDRDNTPQHAAFKGVPVRRLPAGRKRGDRRQGKRGRVDRRRYITFYPASSRPPPGSNARTVRVVGVDKHLPELKDARVHLLKSGEFVDVNTVPVCLSLPRQFSFAADNKTGQAVLMASSSQDRPSANNYIGHSGIRPWELDLGEVPVNIARVLDAMEGASLLHQSMSSRYGSRIGLPALSFPDLNDLFQAEYGDDDYPSLRSYHDQVTDQHGLLLVARELVERSVANYIEAQIEHCSSEQLKARRARKEAMKPLRGEDSDETDEEDSDDEQPDEDNNHRDILPVILDFSSVSSRHTNSVQDEVVKDWYDNNAARLFNDARNEGCAATHVCYRPQDLNFYHQINSVENQNPHVYHEGLRGKGGSAGNGKSRIKGLAIDHNDRGLSPPELYSVMDLANLTVRLQEKAAPFHLKESERFMCPGAPLTLIETAIDDMTGMSVGTRLLKYSLVTPYDPARIGSGGLGMNGLLSVDMRNTYEAGFQRHLEANNVAQVGDMLECCSSGSFSLALFLLRLLQKIMQRLVDDLVEDGFYRHEDVIERLKIWLGWKPGRLETMPEKFRELKELVAEAICGPGFDDAFGDDCPMVTPESYEDCHASKRYTNRQRRGAVANTERSVIIPMERDGNTVRVLDGCEEGFKSTRTESMEKLRELGVELDDEIGVDEEVKMPSMLLHLMARDTSESFGLPANSPDAPRWKVYRKDRRSYNYWRDLGFIAMNLACPDKKLRLLLIVVPWCRLGFHKPGVIMGFQQMARSLRSSCSSTATEILLDVLCFPRTAVDRSLDRRIF